MNMRQLSKRLRNAADVLDELFEGDRTPAVASRILKQADGTKRPYKKHWTKRPENKAKVALMIKRIAAAKKANRG